MCGWNRQKQGLARLMLGLYAIFLLTLASTAVGNEQQKLQALLEPRLANSTATAPTIADAVAIFFQQRQWQPVWDDKHYQALLVEIQALSADGLLPADYFLAELQALENPQTEDTRANREILATHAYLLALKHLYRGKVNPIQISPEWNFDTPPAMNNQTGISLARAAVENMQIAATFERARPAFARYQQMRAALAQLRTIAEHGGWPQLPAGASLKPGMTDERVTILRERLRIAGLYQENRSDTVYDSALETALRRFQKANYLESDGIIGNKTLQQLNISVQQRIDQLRVNLERMRWHLREMHGDAVIVDVAGYRIVYLRDGKVIWHSRVQVGRTLRKTPTFQSAIDHITINPRWKVPPTILKQDMLPAIRKDRNYLQKHHIRIFNANGEELSPASVDWKHPGAITLQQDAGPAASLGQMAIRFPNPFSVYLHETPSTALFNEEQRAFSSGCIRVENVRELAVLLLNDSNLWSREKLELAITNGITQNVSLPAKVPVLIAYWTADMDENGEVSYRPDIYGQDGPVLAKLDAQLNESH